MGNQTQLTTDFRALCAELVAAIGKHVPSTGGFGTVYDPAQVDLDELLCRAHAALAEPEPNVLPPEHFDALQRRLDQPGQYDSRVARVLSTPAPWDDPCDKTS